MPVITFIPGGHQYEAFAELYYDHDNDHLPISQTDWTKLRTLQIKQLDIIAFISFNPNHITLPSLADFTDITILNIRFMTFQTNMLPPLPPNLIKLVLNNTNIIVLNNLPSTLQSLTICNNQQLISVVLPPGITSFEAVRQTKIRVLTLQPNIVYLRLVECRFERINGCSINTLRNGILRYVGVNRRCDTPYLLFNNTQNTPYTFLEIFNEIQTVNRNLDESFMSILYRIREYSYTHSTPSSESSSSPILNALSIASNPPRRFSEFIMDS
jgi:hypothetical protein